MALNLVWLGFFLLSFLAACVRLIGGDTTVFPALLTSLFDSSRTAFEISLGLVGVMIGVGRIWLSRMPSGRRMPYISRSPFL